jgi:DNA invertase Pin-like site-specific DNA recombinase
MFGSLAGQTAVSLNSGQPGSCHIYLNRLDTAGQTSLTESVNLIAYIRVSTDRQADEGQGLDVQEAAIRRWARANGHRIRAWHRDEGVSGTNDVVSRPGLHSALLAIEAGEGAALVVFNLDRLARKLTVQEAVLAHVWQVGAKVFSVGDGGEVFEDDPDDPMRTAIRQMRGVFAQLERSMIAKRLRDGRRMKAEKGGFAYGSPAFGFKAESRTLVAEESEQEALRRIRELSAQGSSLRSIAAVLAAEGFKPKRSDRWHPETLRRIVDRLNAEAVRA